MPLVAAQLSRGCCLPWVWKERKTLLVNVRKLSLAVMINHTEDSVHKER